ncbi:Glycerol-3-phosphate dehydrogenase mitochondrial [Spathaspora sp. JA1]|nr:Glycerol-3-phosphate dehydrogenase mitochondrial [Spathaspora sp. JA1]
MSHLWKQAWVRTAVKYTAISGGVVGAGIIYLDFIKARKPALISVPRAPLAKECATPPLRKTLLDNLNKDFDVLVIGGGCVGTGTALDATTRGLNVCLLEKSDFASGTSSKSTKLAHGGVRYLEKAIFQLSKAQLDLVVEALSERSNMLKIAPHLVTIQPIMVPVYTWWQVPYIYIGCKMYDWFAASQSIRSSKIFGPSLTRATAPMMDSENLKACCIYHDGIFNDSRFNSSLAVTAIENGATVLNYMEVDQLLKDETGKVIGVRAHDRETNKSYNVRAKAVVNATGPFVDKFLEMDASPEGLPPKEEQLPKMVIPSTGTHVVLPEHYCPKDYGLLDPNSADGRVMFFLPWQGKVLAGTTDNGLKYVVENPVATEEDITNIMNALQKYLAFPVRREDVLSAWAGIRPLARDPATIVPGKEGSTEGIVRSHLLTQNPKSELVTITGGKWTTYRNMAEETVDFVVEKFDFKNKDIKPCQTKNVSLIGADNYYTNYASQLIQEYNIPTRLAEHLAGNYGTRAPLVLELYKANDFNRLPVTLAASKSYTISESSNSDTNLLNFEAFDEPFTVAELKYCLKYEYARTPQDFLARRTRLAFLNARAALKAVDGVTNIMAQELKWDKKTTEKMRKDATDYISYSLGVIPSTN